MPWAGKWIEDGDNARFRLVAFFHLISVFGVRCFRQKHAMRQDQASFVIGRPFAQTVFTYLSYL